MVKTLVALVSLYLVTLVEVAAVALILVGLGLAWGAPAVFVGAGAALLVKSFEMDLARGGKT